MTYVPPDFELIAREDAVRIGRLQLQPAEELRVAGGYDHWLQRLTEEARKQRDMTGLRSSFHPNVIIRSIPGRDVRRNIILDWGDGAEPDLFAQIWIETSGTQHRVMYRFAGYGYPSGDQEPI